MTTNSCMTCHVTTTSDNILVCSGLCKNVAHFKCVGLRKNAFDLISSSSNVFWFCDNCKDVFNTHVNKLSELETIINKIGTSVQKIEINLNNKVQDNNRVASSYGEVSNENEPKCPPISVLLEHNNLNNSSKISTAKMTSSGSPVNAATINEDVTVPPIMYDSSILSLPSTISAPKTYSEVVKSPIIMSTKSDVCSYSVPGQQDYIQQQNNTVNSCCISDQHIDMPPHQHQYKKSLNQIRGTKNVDVNFKIQTVAPMFWIHLSRFDNETSEDDVLTMAKTCLGTTKCKISKLIPKNKNINELEYICFKLGIHEDFRAKALDPATWPIGVCIREFPKINFRLSLPSRAKYRIPAVMDSIPV